MYTAAVQVRFSAAHRHRGRREECGRIHGHNYRAEALAEAEALEEGMAVDFSLLREVMLAAVGGWDHRLLNETEDFREEPPTTEAIARRLYEKVAASLPPGRCRLKEVKVYETDDCWASYRKEL